MSKFIFTFLFFLFPALSFAEHVCVQDLNNNGYSGDPGETDVCISNPAGNAFYCPIGAVACDKVTETTSLPSVKQCPAGYTLNAAKTSCTKNNMIEQPPTNNCPPDYSYNASTGLCVVGSTNYSPPVLSCPSGYTLDPGGQTCTKSGYVYQPPTNSCPSGYSYDSSSNLCVTGSSSSSNPTWSCPAGQTLRDGKCYSGMTPEVCTNLPTNQKECDFCPTCPSGTYFEGNWKASKWKGTAITNSNTGISNNYFVDQNYIWLKGAASSQSSGGFITRYSVCRCTNTDLLAGNATPSCSSGTFNSSTGKCESSSLVTAQPTKSCAAGYSYNVAANHCEKLEVTTVPVAISCADGTYSAASNKCEKPTSLTATPTKSCPSDFTYNTAKGVCERTEVVTIAITHVCENGYSFNPKTGVCEHYELVDSCPLSGGGICVKSGASSAAYCSPNPCMNRSDAVTEGNIDGGMLVDNGEKDEQGMCTDQVMIFTGRASECLPSGTSTAFQNCCKNTGTISNDSVGAKNMVGNGVQAIKYLYQVSTAAAGAYTSAMNAGATQTQAANAAANAAQTQVEALMNPATIAWAVAIYLIMDYLMQSCDTLSMETSMAADSGFCHELGIYCKTKWLGQCVQKAKSYCCFNSKMARIIHEQGRAQLKSFQNGFGVIKEPDCRGFTPEEFQALDFSKIDMTEYYNDLVHNTQQSIQQSINTMTQDYYESIH